MKLDGTDSAKELWTKLKGVHLEDEDEAVLRAHRESRQFLVCHLASCLKAESSRAGIALAIATVLATRLWPQTEVT